MCYNIYAIYMMVRGRSTRLAKRLGATLYSPSIIDDPVVSGEIPFFRRPTPSAFHSVWYKIHRGIK